MAGETRTLDTHQERSSLQVPIGVAQNGLLEFSPAEQGKIIAGLAERWEVSQDGKTYTFYLRANAKWHDGKPLTTEDVKFSIERMSKPQKGLTIERLESWALLERIQIVDRSTVQLVLKAPSAPFLSILAERHAVMIPKHWMEAGGNPETSIVGTGPFKLTRYQRGIRYDFVRNPDYWVPERPYLDGISWFIIRDQATHLAAFKAGELHLTAIGSGAITQDEIEVLKRDMPEAVFIRSGVYNGPGFYMNWNRKPWNDIRVRRAAHLALDRQEAIKVLERGNAEVSGFFAPGQVEGQVSREEISKMPGFRQPKQADIDAAKKLLAEAGYGQGFSIEMPQRSDDASGSWAQVVAAQLSKIGIKATVRLVPKAVSDELRLKEEFDAFAIQLTAGIPDIHEYARFFATKGTGNYSRHNDPKIFDLFAKQQTELDSKRRAQIARETDLYLLDVLPGAPLYWAPIPLASKPTVRGLHYMNYNTNVRFQDVWLTR